MKIRAQLLSNSVELDHILAASQHFRNYMSNITAQSVPLFFCIVPSSGQLILDRVPALRAVQEQRPFVFLLLVMRNSCCFDAVTNLMVITTDILRKSQNDSNMFQLLKNHIYRLEQSAHYCNVDPNQSSNQTVFFFSIECSPLHFG